MVLEPKYLSEEVIIHPNHLTRWARIRGWVFLPSATILFPKQLHMSNVTFWANFLRFRKKKSHEWAREETHCVPLAYAKKLGKQPWKLTPVPFWVVVFRAINWTGHLNERQTTVSQPSPGWGCGSSFCQILTVKHSHQIYDGFTVYLLFDLFGWWFAGITSNRRSPIRIHGEYLLSFCPRVYISWN